MVRRTSFFLLFMFAVFAAMAANIVPDYEIEGAGTGNQGTYLVKVSVISKDKKPSEDVIARCAVHGVLFRGFSSKENRQSHKPLAGGPANEAAHAEYYANFFSEGGAAKNYVQSLVGSRSTTKIGKQYKVSTIVTVSKDQLVKDLQAAGVMTGLNSIF